MDFLDTNRAGLQARLQHIGRRDICQKEFDLLIIQHVDKRRHGNTRALRLRPHREFVTEMPRRRVSHAGHAKMLT